MRGKVIFFATNNVNKFNEAREVLAEYNIAVGMLRAKSMEIQSESLEEIAQTSALDAFERCNLPIIVEDAGLFAEALRGFPGPYASYVYKTIGNEGLLQLMENVALRRAVFRSVVAYHSAELKSPLCFSGEIAGEIVQKETRKSRGYGFGFDPIFKPSRSRKTFAQMTLSEKNVFSHRAFALRKFASWYKSRRLDCEPNLTSRADGNS
jgi:XTP/dITP diphosphohydrolase